MKSTAGLPTGVALIVVDARGENQIAVASGANGAVDGELVRAQLADWRPSIAGGVVLAVFEVGDDAILAAARFAAEHGLRLVINPAPARTLPAEVVTARYIHNSCHPRAGGDPVNYGVAKRLNYRTGFPPARE
jgi:ribokinase